MSKRLDLTGQRFGKLLVVGFAGLNKYKQFSWNCICDCGEFKVVGSRDLRTGGVKSCGCLKRYKDKSLSVKKQLYSIFCHNAKKRLHKIEIDFEQYVKLISQPCFYCGLIGSNTHKRDYINFDLRYNGLDRINNNLGYIESNVVTCCKHCNRAKSDMTAEEFQDWIRRVHSHYIQPNEQMDYNI